jgi:hypothetical protein
VVMVAAYFLVRVSSVRVVVTRTVVPPPPVIAPSVPSRVTILQRGEQPLAGTGGTVNVSIGDITRGQTLLTIRDAGGTLLLTPRSVRQGDIHTFNAGKAAFDIEVIELENFMTSEDYGVFEIRTAGSPPATTRAAATSRPAA